MNYLIGLVLLVAGWAIYEHWKRRGAEALNQNVEIKQQVSKINEEIARNQGLLDAEKEKQDDLNKQIEEDNKDVSQDELLDHFNSKRNTTH